MKKKIFLKIITMLFLILFLGCSSLENSIIEKKSFDDTLKDINVNMQQIYSIVKINNSFLLFYKTSVDNREGLGVYEIDYNSETGWNAIHGESHYSSDKITLGLITGFFGDSKQRLNIIFGYVNDPSINYVKVKDHNIKSLVQANIIQTDNICIWYKVVSYSDGKGLEVQGYNTNDELVYKIDTALSK